MKWLRLSAEFLNDITGMTPILSSGRLTRRVDRRFCCRFDDEETSRM